jgi:hypothetical protein
MEKQGVSDKGGRFQGGCPTSLRDKRGGWQARRLVTHLVTHKGELDAGGSKAAARGGPKGGRRK